MVIEPKGIVVHSMAEYLDLPEGPVYAKDFLESINLSVHGFITPDGRYDKMVDSPEKAFHAGHSEWNGYRYLNSHFLGFELLVKGVHNYGTFIKEIHQKDCYTEAQFEMAVEVCRWWMGYYNIEKKNIIRHSDCSGDDVRGEGKGKKDPGPAFDWERFKKSL